MVKQGFINLPVKELKRSVDFFTKMGFTFNPQLTDENATSLVLSDTIYVMLLVEEFYKSFTKKQIPDTKKSSEVIIALGVETFEEVDTLAQKALDAGGVHTYTEDHGWMKGIGFTDPDGHYWEISFTDLSKFPG